MNKLRLKNVCEEIVDCEHKTAPVQKEGYPSIRTVNIGEGMLILNGVNRVSTATYKKWTKRIVPREDDLILAREAPIGNVAIIPKELKVCLGQRTVLLRPNQAVVVPQYLMYLLLSSPLQRRLKVLSAGGTVPHLNVGDIRDLLLPTLHEISEQRKIAQILGTWDEAIATVEQLIAALERRKQGLMQRLLTGQVRFPEFAQSNTMQETKYGDIPADWGYEVIGDIAEEKSARNRSTEELPVLSCTKYDGLVNSLEYFGRQIFSDDTSNYKIVKRNQFAYATNHIEEGSIGYQDLYDEAIISPMYTVFQTDDRINDAYLYRLLKTELYRHIFEVNTSGTVNRRGSLRWNDFSKIRVPVPSLSEQNRIAETFDAVDREIETSTKLLNSFKEQKKGLMQRLLTGQVRVQVEGETPWNME